MKKIILLLSLTLSGVSAYSQDNTQNAKIIKEDKAFKREDIKNTGVSRFHIGAAYTRNAVGIINQNSYYRPELEYRVTYASNYGIVGGYDFNDFIGVQMEVNYSGQGQKYKEEIVGIPTQRRQIETSYIQVPLMLKFMGGPAPIRFYAIGGIQYGYLIAEAISIDGVAYSPRNISPKATSDRFFERHEWGVKFGTGADFRATDQIYINAGINFFAGLTDINVPAFRRNGHEFATKPYIASTNASVGGNIGVHYVFKSREKLRF